MSFIDRLRDLLGRNKAAEYGAAATAGAVVASTSDDPARDVDEPAPSGPEGVESGGGWDFGGGDVGGGGGDGGGGGG
jgi:hypothetical protein